MPCGCRQNPCQDCPPELVHTLPDCNQPDTCEESHPAKCIKYTGPNLPNIGVTNGLFLKDILIKINKAISGIFTSTYTITVTSTQKVTVVEYINNLGNLVSVSTSKDQSPRTITAQTGSAVIISGTGTIS